MVKVPDTIAGTLAPEILTDLDAKLGPPPQARIAASFEVEIEAEGEGTFTLAYQSRALVGRKGFAQGDPLLSMRVPRGGARLVQALLQAAADGFPQAPALAARHAALRALTRADLELLLKNVQRAKPMGVVVEVAGHGSFAVARGALDEVTRTLTVSMDGAQLLALTRGAALESARPSTSGDRTLGAELATVLAPVLLALRRGR